MIKSILECCLLFLLLLISLSCEHRENLEQGDVPVAFTLPTNTPEPSRLIDFHFKGVRLGDSEQKILNVLGRPTNRKIVKSDFCGISELMKLNYDGVEFWLDDASEGKESSWTVLEIRVTTPKIFVDPGVSIGDDVSAIKQRFGHPNVDRTDEPAAMFYLTRDNDNAGLDIKNNKVSRIRLFINPC